MAADEAIEPVMDDFILYSVIKGIDPYLLDHIQAHYQLEKAVGFLIIDVKDDIFSNITKLLNLYLGTVYTVSTQDR